MALAKHAEEINEKRIENMERANSRNREQEIHLYAAIPLRSIPVDLSFHFNSNTKQSPSKSATSKGIRIRCCDCGKEFTFSVGEQEFYRKHNYHNPKRCGACRKIRRNNKERRFWDGLVRSN